MSKSTEPFIKMARNSKNFWELIKRRHSAYVLLSVVAQRARRTDDVTFDDLEIGEAYLGDHKIYGASRQNYRTDIRMLKNLKFLTTRSTSKGTIAKLCDDSIFDINATIKLTKDLTNSQPSPNHRLTTNKNDKNVKNDKNIYIQEAQIFLEAFNEEYGGAYRSTNSWLNNFIKHREVYSLDDLIEAVRKAKSHPFWKDKLDPDKLLRTHEDRIGQLLSYTPRSRAL